MTGTQPQVRNHAPCLGRSPRSLAGSPTDAYHGPVRGAAAKLPHQRFSAKQKAAELKRQKSLEDIAADPNDMIAQIESHANWLCEQAAERLVDLREALGPAEGPALARAVAEKIHKQNPKNKNLAAALRESGLLQ